MKAINQELELVRDELITLRTRLNKLTAKAPLRGGFRDLSGLLRIGTSQLKKLLDELKEIEHTARQDHPQERDSASEWQANTGVNPAPGKRVCVKFKNGTEIGVAYEADLLRWRIDQVGGDIIAWKLATQTGD